MGEPNEFVNKRSGGRGKGHAKSGNSKPATKSSTKTKLEDCQHCAGTAKQAADRATTTEFIIDCIATPSRHALQKESAEDINSTCQNPQVWNLWEKRDQHAQELS